MTLCLHLTVVVSVRISSPCERNRTVWIEDLVERINDLKGNTRSCSKQMIKFINHLSENDMEILNATSDRDAVVWIWCKSQIALKKLQELIEYNTQLDFFCGLFDENPELIERKIVNLDAYQLKREIGMYTIIRLYQVHQNQCSICRGGWKALPVPLTEGIPF